MKKAIIALAVMAAVIRRRFRKHDEEAMAIERAGGPRDQL